jgi:bile acid:Na+ symporter, BASS family
MEPYFTTAAWFFTYLFVVTATAFIGVAASGREIALVLSDRRLMLKALLANLFLVPGLGLVLVNTLPMTGETAAALMLLALAPGGMNALQFTTKVKGELSFASAVLFLLSVASLVFTPIAASSFLKTGVQAAIPFGRITLAVTFFILLPLAIGFAVRAYAPALGRAAARPLNLISTISFVGAVILSASVKKEAMRIIGPEGVVAMFALIVGSMIIGWFLGGPEKGRKRVLASTTSNRNAALCLVIAMTSLQDESANLAILVFLLLAVPANMVFTLYQAIREKLPARPPSPPSG